MLYRRLYTLDSSDHLAAFKTTSSIWASAAAKARTLRSRAARCRMLATTFYDPRIVASLETYAAELEAEVVALQRPHDAQGGEVQTPQNGIQPFGNGEAWNR